jgi:Protein of unknown function (DUF2934)
VSRWLAICIVDFPLTMSTTETALKAIKAALSPARISTYESATGNVGDSDSRAIALYAWTARVSAALFAPLHICEVVIRNAVNDALEAVYGPLWPWDQQFILSLPDPPRSSRDYSPRRDLIAVASKQSSTGKVIPELKFVFWQRMFTHRHDVRLWNVQLKKVFPNHDRANTVVELRKKIYADLNVVRNLRNRIAHHEPIFQRNLVQEFQRMVSLVEHRCMVVASWMVSNQDAARVIAQPPIFRGGNLWTPSHDEVSQLAYRLWCEGGNRMGSPESDWFNAERILGVTPHLRLGMEQQGSDI